MSADAGGHGNARFAPHRPAAILAGPTTALLDAMNPIGDILQAIDQGTSSTRAIAFSPAGDVVAVEQQSVEQIYSGPG